MLSLWANWLVTKFGINSLKRYLWLENWLKLLYNQFLYGLFWKEYGCLIIHQYHHYSNFLKNIFIVDVYEPKNQYYSHLITTVMH